MRGVRSSTRRFLFARWRCFPPRALARVRARVYARRMMITAKGVNGSVEFDGHVLTITRGGLMGRATQGRNSKQIPLASIGAVQLRPPTLAANGVWSVSVVGEVQSSKPIRGVRDVARSTRDDENAVTVRSGQVKSFEALGAAIDEARRSAAVPAPVVVQAPASSEVEGVAAQLRQVGAMHHRGAIDDATFIREMHALLPRL